ncbi:DUF2214 domain-containing protein [Sinorhizobium medicae]|uniref:DUF2214 domain-containing protein n=2 Tax=Sinorhizobium medicae TaxID=110321 RepID=A0A508X4Z5_9HYPH|nr:DUF6644 family protein [Sinorhizobium medicae]ABR59417.1 conserved hypothetical/unknown transmembrane protein [Sinorhizobium medicae WSM419]MBO1939474.1 DUF2214 domain-containing protein [Sinorhizobium medicae]MBO1963298.1 DUF2214 domain-containing protein [Sinorhizobium medicae]MDX0404044.1 DUF2214 domain-containing protein [Sinorhizobium medicae]MDX0409920.1 DUF2214 domain-containing protein [Sinorhizobium medicae]
MEEALTWIGALPVAGAIRRSAVLYIFVNAAHILSIGIIVGSILPLDLRLLGFFPDVPVGVIGPYLSRAAAIGIASAMATGLCLFSVRPVEYAGNPAFLTKMTLLAIGVLNAVLLHMTPQWRDAVKGGPLSLSVRVSALLSMSIWTGAVLSGRWIGFLSE